MKIVIYWDRVSVYCPAGGAEGACHMKVDTLWGVFVEVFF